MSIQTSSQLEFAVSPIQVHTVSVNRLILALSPVITLFFVACDLFKNKEKDPIRGAVWRAKYVWCGDVTKRAPHVSESL